MQSPVAAPNPRQRSTSNSPRDLYNISPSVIAYSNTPADLGENDNQESGPETDSSDENIENLVEQVNKYDFGDDDEDWDSVVYQGPTLKSQSVYERAQTAPGHMDGWYPFGKLEVCTPVIFKLNLRGKIKHLNPLVCS
jgi:hypothetical protein